MSQIAARVDAETAARPGAPTAHPEFDRLVRTMWRLRQPDGCPWDREQTHRSITKNMVEEAYEAVEAIETDDREHLVEELGDVLEQVVLHAQIAADEGAFTIDDVVCGLNEKLVRRHPHVFGEHAEAGDGGEVQDIWDEVKAAERAAAGEAERPQGLLDSVPRSLPALMQCQKISKRAAKAGFEWADEAGVWEKVAEERTEMEGEAPGSPERAAEFGDLLFALVNVARWEGIDAEEALAASNRKFRARWARMEALATEMGTELGSLGTDEMNELWNRAKAEEKPA
ncbi:nucleoside triphosphate pyrophosphohydrolase [Thermophilibacter provencensis]|uniref:Nucleoside triphosphate pyrophosphohydrolase n=1 Tax=Thermophilibacter provencensis TaxID=1852386 RepID=A0ABT7V4V8_9ACTN|nr:nucleoside triphosphate pyrophosphohydrolase [Thermophilibacter provencensis]MDM8271635.1 nucleoside triphosphate pyrophosphohydrolase [Thermophilibacter provencensis]